MFRCLLLLVAAALIASPQQITGQTIPPVYSFDIASIIDIHSAEDAQILRRRLIDTLWCGQLPSGQPAHDGKHIIVDMEFGLRSIGRWHGSPQPGKRLLIYHNGHSQGLGTYPALISTWTQAGYDVAELMMPGMAENSPVWAHDEDFGRIYAMYRHETYGWLKPTCGHPLKFFLEPVIVLVNWAEQAGYSEIAMMGLSGGGWTTTLAAAIDTRITRSVPVAGSVPFYLRQGANIGDWEQWAPEIYRIAEYLELYIMATDGGRQQLQILNEFDDCCFAGREAESYASIVAERAATVGGQWQLWIDSTHRKHKISEAAIEQALDAMQAALPTPTAVAPAEVATPTPAVTQPTVTPTLPTTYLPLMRR